MSEIPEDVMKAAHSVITSHYGYMISPGKIIVLEREHERLAKAIALAVMAERKRQRKFRCCTKVWCGQ